MYTINFTDSKKQPINLPDNFRDGPGESQAHTSLTLLGKGSEDYGDELWTNFIRLLDNFCSDGDLGPSKPTEGQLWYSTKSNTLKVYKQKPSSDIILPASDNQPISNTIEYYWEDLIDGSKYGDNSPAGILQSFIDGFKEPLSDAAKALLKLLESYFLSINGGTLKGEGKLYIKPLVYNTTTVMDDYTNNIESHRAANVGFIIEYVNGFVQQYLAEFGFDTSAFGKKLDSGNGTTSSEYIPLTITEDLTVSGKNLKFNNTVEVPDIITSSTPFESVNKKYADGLFTVATLTEKLNDATIIAKINSVVTVGGGSGNDAIDYDVLSTKLSTNDAFIQTLVDKIVDKIKLDVIAAIKADESIKTLQISTIDAAISKYHVFGISPYGGLALVKH